jgi:hypothetical protein
LIRYLGFHHGNECGMVEAIGPTCTPHRASSAYNASGKN